MGASTSSEPEWRQPVARRTVLVTGGAGLLGRPLVKELVGRGFAVMSVSSKPWRKFHPRVQQLFSSMGVSTHMLDLAVDADHGGQGLSNLIEMYNFDLVINLAADRGGVKYDGTRMLMNNKLLNTTLPTCLVETSARLKVPLFLLSTEYVWTGLGNTAEGYPPIPAGTDPQDRFVKEGGAPYAVQKYQAELAAEKRRVSLGDGRTNVTIVRIPLLYGNILSSLEDGTATSSISNYLSDNNWKHDTWQKRYPTCADDAAFVIAALARKRLSDGLEYGVYNYGSQFRTSKFEFMQTFAKEAGLPLNEVHEVNAGEFAADRRPPYDVRLDIRQTRDELSKVGDWKEPRRLDGAVVKSTYFGIFTKEIREKAQEVERRSLLRQASVHSPVWDPCVPKCATCTQRPVTCLSGRLQRNRTRVEGY